MTLHVSPTIELAQDLINRRSVTPEDAGCQDLMIERLEALGFKIERLHGSTKLIAGVNGLIVNCQE